MNDMVDMSRFIEVKSDQLNADDLIGTTRTITVRKVTGQDGDQPVSIFYEGDNNKPFKPCKTIRRVLMAVWGRNGADYVGKSMTLYRDDRVTFGGLETGGIRISHMSHMDKEMTVVVMAKKGKKAGVKILPLRQERQQGEDGAAKWAASYVAKINSIELISDLAEFANSKATKLEELSDKRPDLHKRCVEALDARRTALDEPNDGTLSDENPTAAEGMADEDRGEVLTGYGEE